MLDSHAGEADRRYATIRAAVLKRDRYTCAFCGFAAKKYQEIHHLDDNHGNNAPANLATACPLCHAAFHLGMVGIKNAGLIIWCPEYSQAEINTLSRAIFVAVENKGVQEDAARTLYNALETRAIVTEERLGKGASSPAAFGKGLLDLKPEAYATRGERLHGFRLLPRRAAFHGPIAYWASEPKLFGKYPDEKWERLLVA